MRFYMVTVGEENPDWQSDLIEKGLSRRHGVLVNKSHAALLVEGAGKYDGIWESMGDGFKGPKDPVKSLEGSVIRDKVLLNVPNGMQAIRWLREFHGTRYANLQYLLFAPAWMNFCFKWMIPTPVRRLIRNGKMLSFCSESVAHFIRNNCVDHAGVEAFEDPCVSAEKCDEVDPFTIVPLAEKYGVRV